MSTVPAIPEVDDDLHMGSEYASAKTFLARDRRGRFGEVRKKKEPQHGSNDSDFGIADQAAD